MDDYLCIQCLNTYTAELINRLFCCDTDFPPICPECNSEGCEIDLTNKFHYMEVLPLQSLKDCKGHWIAAKNEYRESYWEAKLNRIEGLIDYKEHRLAILEALGRLKASAMTDEEIEKLLE